MNIWFGEANDGSKRQSIWRRAVNVASHPREVARQLTARVRSESPAYMRQLDVPEGAIDMFHVIHLDRPLVSQWLGATRLTVTDVGRHEASVFLRAEPR